jgi:hypothetical protein
VNIKSIVIEEKDGVLILNLVPFYILACCFVMEIDNARNWFRGGI